jgi:D-beta-D-heptose 7-phosphate kinase / D-beta-D-heptose 1-phosphate adenosyltransferase
MIDLKNARPKILVIGDLMIDRFLWGSCERISPEAPVQIINIENESTSLGGAGNVINNLNSLGAKVDFISVIGDCNTSNELLKLLSDIKVGLQYLITQNKRITSKKTRIISSQQQVIRYDKESNDEININSQNKLLKIFEKIVNDYDTVLLSDYGKGVLTYNVCQSLISIANKNNIKILVDPKGLNYSKYKGAYLLTPNKKEAGEATNVIINDKKSLKKALQKLKNQCNLAVSIITLSEEGIAIFDNELRTQPTAAREVFDVTGAGDTVIAALGFALSSNKNIDEAVKFANLASGVVVGKVGSATTTLDEIIEYESNLRLRTSDKNIKNLQEILTIVSELKKNNKKIVFTNGCFDILHIGHIKYLEAAKSHGDILIVGLNSDHSIEIIKGANRPINPVNDRANIIAALKSVDYLIVFDEETPLNLIRHINPDVLVKGGDYENKKVIGEEIVNKLVIIPFIKGKSTTKLIERIKSK